jgi:hypothetical protein
MPAMLNLLHLDVESLLELQIAVFLAVHRNGCLKCRTNIKEQDKADLLYPLGRNWRMTTFLPFLSKTIGRIF